MGSSTVLTYIFANLLDMIKCERGQGTDNNDVIFINNNYNH